MSKLKSALKLCNYIHEHVLKQLRDYLKSCPDMDDLFKELYELDKSFLEIYGLLQQDSSIKTLHADASKGIDEDSNLSAEQCGDTPGGDVYCAKGIMLADREDYNSGIWGKGAFVFGSSESPPGPPLEQLRNLKVINGFVE